VASRVEAFPQNQEAVRRRPWLPVGPGRALGACPGVAGARQARHRLASSTLASLTARDPWPGVAASFLEACYPEGACLVESRGLEVAVGHQEAS